MSTRFQPDSHLHTFTPQPTIETFCLLRMMQTHFAEFACVCIQQCDLFELGVIIDSYNDHCSAPFSRACWLFSTTNFTRGWEPTSSWNQYHSLTPALEMVSSAKQKLQLRRKSSL